MLEPTPRKFPNRKRPRRDPKPRFKPAAVNQFDVVFGCLELQVPRDHLARKVMAQLNEVDLTAAEAKYSSLGRRGYHPRHVLGALVYGSMIGLHHSTKLAKAMKTDAALRLVAGGHPISGGRLRAFRRENEDLMRSANEQVLAMANSEGLVNPKELATDSVRLRAHASTKAARTLKRSHKRVAELAAVDISSLDAQARRRHEAKLAKHQAAIAECERSGRTNIVTTCPSAGLLKFPNGATAPGHRVTVTAVGAKQRLIVDVLIDADATDYGKLQGSMERTRKLFERIGVKVEGMQVAADAGYWSEQDLKFAVENRGWVDVLIAERQPTYRGNDELTPLFAPGAFTIRKDGKAICPAGAVMDGPFKDGRASRFHGVGCASCPLKVRCTKGARKYLTIDPTTLWLRSEMQERMAKPEAAQRYHQRIATVEPVFASIEDTMGFRRVSARHEKSVRAEVMLKVLAHNVSRLVAHAKRLFHVRVLVCWKGALAYLAAA